MEMRSKGKLGMGKSGDQTQLRESFGVTAVPWFDGHWFVVHWFDIHWFDVHWFDGHWFDVHWFDVHWFDGHWFVVHCFALYWFSFPKKGNFPGPPEDGDDPPTFLLFGSHKDSGKVPLLTLTLGVILPHLSSVASHFHSLSSPPYG
ncbi:hypothetical protein HGM15179_013918 [Zosterops borbonicus]|uniref:Uncharacterized protein n=1 Tax=Zosterops borbonicus TaxID=364589 RepID=A0A8K1LGJ7_9PASS|nr:hypothetical protein HGM15179_013918 [Zosterops borbonicus]